MATLSSLSAPGSGATDVGVVDVSGVKTAGDGVVLETTMVGVVSLAGTATLGTTVEVVGGMVGSMILAKTVSTATATVQRLSASKRPMIP